MSHFTVTIVLPEAPKHREHAEQMVAELIAPYDENTTVEPYKSYEKPLPENWQSLDRREMPWPYSFLRDNAPDLDLTDNAAIAAWSKIHWADEPYEADEQGLYRMSTYNPLSKWDWWVLGGRWDGFYKLLDGTPANFARRSDIDAAEKRVQTYAVLAEGVWKSPGEMGWFGMSSETSEEQMDFDTWFQQFWDTMPPETWLAVIDAHI